LRSGSRLRLELVVDGDGDGDGDGAELGVDSDHVKGGRGCRSQILSARDWANIVLLLENILTTRKWNRSWNRSGLDRCRIALALRSCAPTSNVELGIVS
jgi:hypothetical protein